MQSEKSQQDKNTSLVDFIEQRSKNSHLRVQDDLGDGFFRLRASEAQRRQAKQDIRCNEDIVVEMLRNSRDAGAKNIFLSTNTAGNTRFITVIDDGSGVDKNHHEHIFEPYVTSKLDTMTKDMFGVHGRGMALYSIKLNTKSSKVMRSAKGSGCSILIESTTDKLKEKKDQSTFPTFNINEENSLSVRGPKNILRTSCEFAIESRSKVNVYVGSPAEIASTMYYMYVNTSSNIFGEVEDDTCCTKLLSFAADPNEFSELAHSIGLEMSSRTARRIIDGDIAPVKSLLEIISECGINKHENSNIKSSSSQNFKPGSIKSSVDKVKLSKISNEDKQSFCDSVKKDFAKLANKYYLESDIDPKISLNNNILDIKIDIKHKQD